MADIRDFPGDFLGTVGTMQGADPSMMTIELMKGLGTAFT